MEDLNVGGSGTCYVHYFYLPLKVLLATHLDYSPHSTVTESRQLDALKFSLYLSKVNELHTTKAVHLLTISGHPHFKTTHRYSPTGQHMCITGEYVISTWLSLSGSWSGRGLPADSCFPCCRKLGKSTLVLVPLFGVHYFVLWGLSTSTNTYVELVWLFLDQVFASFQASPPVTQAQ